MTRMPLLAAAQIQNFMGCSARRTGRPPRRLQPPILNRPQSRKACSTATSAVTIATPVKITAIDVVLSPANDAIRPPTKVARPIPLIARSSSRARQYSTAASPPPGQSRSTSSDKPLGDHIRTRDARTPRARNLSGGSVGRGDILRERTFHPDVRNGSRLCKNSRRWRRVAVGRRKGRRSAQVRMAAISGPVPRICITRFRL
jgi:hypothetical protein